MAWRRRRLWRRGRVEKGERERGAAGNRMGKRAAGEKGSNGREGAGQAVMGRGAGEVRGGREFFLISAVFLRLHLDIDCKIKFNIFFQILFNLFTTGMCG